VKRRLWTLGIVGGTVGLVLIGCGLVGFRVGETLWTSGVEAFFGQLRLTRDSGPTPPRDLVSNELLLGEVSPSEINKAALVLLPEEVYFWDPAYVGFAQAELTKEEALQLLESMASGHAFASPDTREVLCLQRATEAEPRLAACEQGPAWRAIHQETRLTAELESGLASLQFRFADGRLAEYRLYSANGLLAYSAVERNQAALEGSFSPPEDLLPSIAARAVVGPVRVLWPSETPEQANAHAARLLGRRYRDGLDFLIQLDALPLALGRIVEVRPAEGGNWSWSWMDSSGVDLTLRVVGELGEGVVLLQGKHCWEAEMMLQGRLIDLTTGPACPDP